MKFLKIGLAVACTFIVLAGASFFIGREEAVHLLYATNGPAYDPSAYESLHQSISGNLRMERADLGSISARQLDKFDAVYLDPSLIGSRNYTELLVTYVHSGGHLFLENGFAADFPLDFLGASRLVELQEQTGLPKLDYPDEIDPDLRSLQQVFRRFSDDYWKRDEGTGMPGFSWGQGIVPAGAATVVSMEDVTLVASNRYGQGTVLLNSTFLPNRYFITGTDLTSGQDPKLGFAQLAAERKLNHPPTSGAVYFDRSSLPLEPFYHFSFAAANTLFRGEYISYVSKKKLGYSVSKVLGTYGRPAMAYQNHFEALPAIRDQEGIQWAELLKKYKQIPSFSLVRSAFWWGHWQEGVVVHLNVGTNEKPAFSGETPNSFYSSGTRLMADGKAVQLADYPDYKSLGDPIDKPYRVSPAIADVNGDGRPDLIAGSASGAIAVFANASAPAAAGAAANAAYASQALPPGTAAPYAFAAAQPLRGADGAALAAADGFASVAAGDLQGDGLADLAIGQADGTVQDALRGSAGCAAASAAEGVRVAGPAAPAIGDADGDGVADLVVGGADGRVTLFRGRGDVAPLAFEAGHDIARVPAANAVPSLRDMNGDRRLDLVVGTAEGDLRVFLQGADGTWTASGVLEAATTNQLGSRALVGGHNSAPVWADMNGDGKDDLVVGQLEFGNPTTIDDPAFPYADQLKAFIDYTRNHHLELVPHLFFHNFTSDAGEKQELALHKQAFDRLGIPWTMTGTNQHTWRINDPDPAQTFRNERDAGLWYNFGYRPSHAPIDPRLGSTPEYIWGLPFMMTASDVKQPMLLHTPSPILRLDSTYSTVDLYESYAALDMPIDYFEHIEYHFPTRVGELLEFVTFLEDIRTKHDYNFMTEPQMAKSFLAALTSDARVTRSWGSIVLDKLLRLIGLSPARTLHIEARTNNIPELAGRYKQSLGFAIEAGSAYADRRLTTDADISNSRNGKLYVGVPQAIAFTFGSGESAASTDIHLTRVNMPIELKKSKSSWRISLLEPGLQQLKLYSPAPVTTEGDGWEAEYDEQTHTTTLTRFGDTTTVTIHF